MPTATNPQTGERLELINGQWVPLGAPQEISTVGNIGSGLNEGIAGLLGTPVDLLTGLLNALGANIQNSVGGRKSFESLLSPFIGDQPTTKDGRLQRRISQEVGASSVPLLGILGTANRVRQLAGPLGAAGQAAARNPATFAATETGLAGAGGAAAQGVAENNPDSPILELAAQIGTPAAISGLATSVPAAVRGTLRGGNQGRQAVQNNIDTFQQAGVSSPSVGQATTGAGGLGGRPVQALEATAGNIPGGNAPMRRAADQTREQLKARIDTIADDLAPRSNVERAGRVIDEGITGTAGFVARFRNTGQQLYNNLYRQIPQTTRVRTENISRTFAEMTTPAEGLEDLSRGIVNPAIRRMNDNLIADLGRSSDGQTIPFQGLMRIRTQVGEMLSGSQLPEDLPRAQVKQVYDALTSDIEQAARTFGTPGPGRRDSNALDAFFKANKFWRAGMTRINDVIERVTKKHDVESMFRIATSGKEGASVVRSVMRSLNTDEREFVASAVLRKMGRATASNQDETGDVFSMETFLTDWSKMHADTRNALFSGSRRMRAYSADIDAITRTASNIKQGARVLSNASGTGPRNIANFTAGGIGVGAAFGHATAAITYAAVTAVTANAASRLMTSPAFVRFLAQSTRVPVKRLPGLIQKLGTDIANPDQELQESLDEYLSKLGV